MTAPPAATVRRAHVTWRYLPRGATRHALMLTTRNNVGHVAHALCGVASVWSSPERWHGTGTQTEHDRAATLPECRRCARLLEPAS